MIDRPPAHSDYWTALLIMGPRATGKSTVGRRIATRLSWGYASFGSYVREQALARGYESDSLQLEELGRQLVSDRGADGLLMDLLASQRIEIDKIVLDGVRHRDMLQAVGRLYRGVVSVYLEAPEGTRYQRWLRREGLSNSDACLRRFQDLSQAPIERHVFGLREVATHILDGSCPVAQSVESIIRLLHKRELQ